ncbi:MAG: YncE family protein [Bacteroidota bacterium]
MTKITFKFAASILLISIVCIAQPKSGYHLVSKIAVGGEEGWDYLTFDPPSHRLFISHGTNVTVINTDSDKVVGVILKTEGVHGIAIADEFDRAFISNGRTSTVSMIQLKTLRLVDTIPVGKNPDAILYDDYSKRVFVFNGRSNDATILDAEKGTVVATLPLRGKPEFSACDGKGHVFVNIEDKNEIVAIDSKTLVILSRWPITPGEGPSGLAIDRENHRLFSVCDNKLMIVLNSDNGAVISSLPIGARVDGCAFDPDLKLAFSSNGEGTVTVIREESPTNFSILETIKTQLGARTIAVDTTRHILYLPTAEFGPAPAPTPEHPRQRPAIIPNTFVILKIAR